MGAFSGPPFEYPPESSLIRSANSFIETAIDKKTSYPDGEKTMSLRFATLATMSISTLVGLGMLGSWAITARSCRETGISSRFRYQ